jgi:hypothetical protein
LTYCSPVRGAVSYSTVGLGVAESEALEEGLFEGPVEQPAKSRVEAVSRVAKAKTLL